MQRAQRATIQQCAHTHTDHIYIFYFVFRIVGRREQPILERNQYYFDAKQIKKTYFFRQIITLYLVELQSNLIIVNSSKFSGFFLTKIYKLKLCLIS